MKKKQSNKGSIAISEQQVKSKSNTGNYPVSKSIPIKEAGKKALKVNNKLKPIKRGRKAEFSPKLTKIFKDLSTLCSKIDKLEKQKRETLRKVLKDKTWKKSA